jgi:hypothetical protein
MAIFKWFVLLLLQKARSFLKLECTYSYRTFLYSIFFQWYCLLRIQCSEDQKNGNDSNSSSIIVMMLEKWILMENMNSQFEKIHGIENEQSTG